MVTDEPAWSRFVVVTRRPSFAFRHPPTASAASASFGSSSPTPSAPSLGEPRCSDAVTEHDTYRPLIAQHFTEDCSSYARAALNFLQHLASALGSASLLYYFSSPLTAATFLVLPVSTILVTPAATAIAAATITTVITITTTSPGLLPTRCPQRNRAGRGVRLRASSHLRNHYTKARQA